MGLTDRILDIPLPVLNHWGYWIILLTAILEATPLFGFVIPGQVIVALGGFLAKLGILDLKAVIFLSAIGAIVGDIIGYFLGRKYGHDFITKYGKHFFFKEEYFKRTKEIMNSHVGKTLVIGRFNSLTRAFAPFVAGASKVPFRKVLFFNIIGGVIWAVVYSFVGYLFGKSYELISKYMGSFIFIAIVFLILAVYGYRFVKKRRDGKQTLRFL